MNASTNKNKKQKNKKLGKGIASLIGASEELKNAYDNTERPGEDDSRSNRSSAPMGPARDTMPQTPDMVDISTIHRNPHQPRKIFSEKELDELANSIKENGILQPLIVTKADRGFELIAGERRLRAAKKAGLQRLPVIIKRGTEKDRAVMAIIENVQRADLNCVEEGLAYFRLMNEYQLTQEEVAKRVGKERSSIANLLRILKLPRQILEMIHRGELAFGHAKVLTATAAKDRDRALALAQLAVEKGLSVRELEKLSKKSPQKAPQEAKEKNPFFEEKVDKLRQKLEQRTGYHFGIKTGKNGSGQVMVKFNNEAEFNDIYEFLMKR